VKAATIENSMREGILRGEFAPDSWLRMEDLKARFTVGFSPIREALSRLVGEGLVEFEPNRGFRVKGLGRADLEDIAVARMAVEVTALRASIEKGDDRWESDILGALHRYRRRAEKAFDDDVSLLAWEQAHDELHAALISACGSPRLMDLQRRLQEQHVRYRRLIVIPEVASQAHVAEHERLVELALARDADTAVAHISDHMRITVDALAASGFWDRKD
jgi:DNA-binding GntR family transcriptional regulator